MITCANSNPRQQCWQGYLLIPVCLLCVLYTQPVHPDTPAGVSALGYLEPRDGLYALSGPSGLPAVVAQLLVDEGDNVARDQVIALLDDLGMKQANFERANAERANAENELRRKQKLTAGAAISAAEIESLEIRLAIADAELAQARAELERAQVRSPIDGRVVAVHARDGERVGDDGIVELGHTDAMYVIAEVYETDIGRVRVGQQVRANSPAFEQPLTGEVERIALKVGKMATLDADPVARTDARVVEVEVRLDDSSRAGELTNLQVEVYFEP